MLRFNRTTASTGILALLCTALVLFSPVSAFAIEAGNIGGRPATPQQGNERTKSIFTYKTDAGKTIPDAIEIFNNSNEQKTIEVYPVDSQVASGGSFACAQKADVPKSVATWIKLSQSTITLEPGKNAKIPFTVSVPKDATPGEQDGCIAIQDAQQAPATQGNGIRISTRSAIRVAIMVNGDIRKQLMFTSLSMQHTEDDKLLTSASLRNTGNVSLDTELDIALKSLGLFAVKSAGGDFPALPGTQSDFNFRIDRPFWGGVYVLAATASFNPDTKAMLGEKTEARAIHASKLIFITPQPLAFVIELLGLVSVLALAFWLVRRFILKRIWLQHGRKHTVKEHENIQDIARAYNVPWKRVAWLNSIKAPYTLRTGGRLVIPGKGSTAKHKKHQA